ncbi:hypothetical protein BpHYR1_003814 [Brachionus plicatilis]|uniref:Uncharacterized protein n=1 Tax=Brachionus plicatilis TaxID=10195 RepID=A0A3M7PUT2_BRAPC|nr:hypothetical protein BpHYR1_003814 [Brachionus plicatilis]
MTCGLSLTVPLSAASLSWNHWNILQLTDVPLDWRHLNTIELELWIYQRSLETYIRHFFYLTED